MALRVAALRRIAAPDVAAAQAHPQVHPARALLQALLAGSGGAGDGGGRSLPQVAAVAGPCRRRDELAVEAGGGVGDPVEEGLLDVDGAESAAQNDLVDGPG